MIIIATYYGPFDNVEKEHALEEIIGRRPRAKTSSRTERRLEFHIQPPEEAVFLAIRLKAIPGVNIELQRSVR